jgi:hypothetical protein
LGKIARNKAYITKKDAIQHSFLHLITCVTKDHAHPLGASLPLGTQASLLTHNFSKEKGLQNFSKK